MPRHLALLRHGLAAGQAPADPLLPAGEAHVARLAAHLRATGWSPAVALTSPYARARATTRVLLDGLGCTVEPLTLDELTPGNDPALALRAVAAMAPGASPVLVVTHLPLIAGMAWRLIGTAVAYAPGTFTEFALDDAPRLLRTLGEHELAQP
jgi:phosphohistidine phosphatase SixA